MRIVNYETCFNANLKFLSVMNLEKYKVGYANR